MRESSAPDAETPAGRRSPAEKATTLATRGSFVGSFAVIVFGALSRLDAFNGAMDGLGKLQGFFKDMSPPVWWALLAGLVLVLLLGLWVEISRLRERRAARRLSRETGEPIPGYFRIGPYRPSDRERYRRADSAHTEVLDWLKTGTSVPLYLTGDSGSGKSSLLNACVIPELQDQGWLVCSARAYRDPAAALFASLAEQRTRRPKVGTTLRELAEFAAAKSPTLLLLDQFEEFLILAEPDARSSFASLVDDLARSPVAKLRLLLVLRSDYQRELGEAGLPFPYYGHNLYELGRFDFNAARAFMTGYPLGLDDTALDRLLHSAATLDGSPGRVRPITLNVLGRILADGRGASAGLDAGRLVRHYLAQTVEKDGVREFARPVLEQLLTDQGTKQPRTQREIVAATGLETYQVLAVLNGLGQAGLTRTLDVASGSWELSHDFVARALSAYLGRRTGEQLRKFRAMAAPLLAGMLLAAAGVYEMAVVGPARAGREPILPDMVDIPAGSFCMGSAGEPTVATKDLMGFIRQEKQNSFGPRFPKPSACPERHEDPEAMPNEMPARRIRMAAFRLGRHEVTAGEFRRYVRAMQAQGHEINWTDDARTVDALPPAERRQKDRLPAVNLNYHEAVAYAEWLWSETGKKGPKYRLPTEAEWEYAARAGTVTRRWWGDDPQLEDACAHANVLDQKALSALKDIAVINWAGFACESDGYVWSAPVGHFGPKGANAFGVQDMLGNVGEWVADCYHASYEGAPAGPEAWLDGTACASGSRVLRGGSWFLRPVSIRAAFRYWNYPDSRGDFIGFRLAQDIR